MKRCCINCHFLAKETSEAVGGSHVFSWSPSDRSNKAIKDHYAAKCWWGMWDCGSDPTLIESLEQLIATDRGDTCFFVETHAGMNFEAAKELQARMQQNRALKRSHLYTTIGLWIAGLGLIANLVFQVLRTFGVIG